MKALIDHFLINSYSSFKQIASIKKFKLSIIQTDWSLISLNSIKLMSIIGKISKTNDQIIARPHDFWLIFLSYVLWILDVWLRKFKSNRISGKFSRVLLCKHENNGHYHALKLMVLEDIIRCKQVPIRIIVLLIFMQFPLIYAMFAARWLMLSQRRKSSPACLIPSSSACRARV